MTKDKELIWIFGIIFGIFGCFFSWADLTGELPAFLQYIGVMARIPVFLLILALRLPESLKFPLFFLMWSSIGISIGFAFTKFRK